jgi:hypothetical protein
MSAINGLLCSSSAIWYDFCVILEPQVWLAEWLGCAVAVKELTGFSDPTDARAWQDMQNEVHMLGT